MEWVLHLNIWWIVTAWIVQLIVKVSLKVWADKQKEEAKKLEADLKALIIKLAKKAE